VVAGGQVVAITGEVGAGKTTLLRALLGVVPAQEGRISWNGVEVGDPATELIPPLVAYLPQVPRLFSEPLAETVLLGRSDADLDRAIWMACLDEDVAEMPDGVHTLIGPRGLRLSGGQIQRAAAARAFVRTPELLVVDDLSSALDVETEQRLWQRLASDRRRTVLMVSHRDHVLGAADQVLVVEDGRIRPG
jgi:ATP-binding cassette, subfamily B, bacterial